MTFNFMTFFNKRELQKYSFSFKICFITDIDLGPHYKLIVLSFVFFASINVLLHREKRSTQTVHWDASLTAAVRRRACIGCLLMERCLNQCCSVF